MIIVCDIDDVLNDLTQKAIALYNARSGKNIQVSDITTYNFSDCLPKEDADAICALFEERELWDSLAPTPGSQDALRTLLRQGHRVYLATATHYKNFGWKMEWLKKYYDFFDHWDVIRIADKSLLRADAMIDDRMENLTNSVCDRICIDQPWNRSASKDYTYDIYRVNNWSLIPNVINDIERKNREWLNR
jgi:5'(3')-deoxyribonucleotidase